MPIPRYSYVDGRYMPHQLAMVHIEDRGYLFSDGVYEGIALINGKLLAPELHFKRLEHSLSVLSINLPMSIGAMEIIIGELARRNRISNGFIYLQITRGVASRNHLFPTDVRPVLVITIHNDKTPAAKEYKAGVAVITTADIRWGRRDAKTISLLPNILAKQKAAENDVKEAWLVDKDGFISEGSTSNAFIVTDDGIKTHPADENILAGVTRKILLDLAKADKIKVTEKAFSIDEAKNAKEAFISSTTMGIMPVVKIDDSTIADAKVGKITKLLSKKYAQYVQKHTSQENFECQKYLKNHV